MSESSNNPARGGRRKDDRSTAESQAAAVATRRASARKLAEQRRQRVIITVTAITVGLALISVVAGVLFDQVWTPSRPVARVGAEDLNRREYWAERRLALAREVSQNFQLLALFGANSQFSSQFQGRSPTIDQQIRTIQSSPVDEATISAWETRQIKEQGAGSLNIQVTPDEVNQRLVSDLASIFLPPPLPPLTATTSLTPTAAVTGTDTISPTAEAAEPTAIPSPTPQPTPGPAEAADQASQIIDAIFRQYQSEVRSVEQDPVLSREDFQAALEAQYREQVLNSKIQEQLVPDAGFTEVTTPERVRARQVLVAVTTPEGAAQAEIDQAFADARARADQLAADLKGGADFAETAAASSDDPGSREQGGDLGFFDASGQADSGATYPPELVQAAFALAPETVSDPIRTQFGWHIIEVVEQEIPSREDQLREARTEALDTWVEEQRAALTIERFPQPTVTPTLEATPLPEPTIPPVYQPGPPTQVPTEAPTAPVGPDVPTPTSTAGAAPAPTGTATTTP